MSEVEKLAQTLNRMMMIVGIVCLVVVVDTVFGPFTGTDSTDSPDKRSGMSLYTV